MNNALHIFSAEELTDKNTPLKREMLSLSFEYMLSYICEGHVDALKDKKKTVSDLNAFNEANELSLPKLLSYPILVAISNGYSNALYNLLGPYKSFQYGAFSTSIFEMLSFKKDADYPPLSFFEIDLDLKPGSIKVKNTADDGSLNFESIRTAILARTLNTDPDLEFQNIKIMSDVRKDGTKESGFLYKAIDHAVDAIQKKTNYQFFKSNEKDILYMSKHLVESFNTALYEDKVEILPYEKVGSARKRFFQLEN